MIRDGYNFGSEQGLLTSFKKWGRYLSWKQVPIKVHFSIHTRTCCRRWGERDNAVLVTLLKFQTTEGTVRQDGSKVCSWNVIVLIMTFMQILYDGHSIDWHVGDPTLLRYLKTAMSITLKKGPDSTRTCFLWLWIKLLRWHYRYKLYVHRTILERWNNII